MVFPDKESEMAKGAVVGSPRKPWSLYFFATMEPSISANVFVNSVSDLSNLFEIVILGLTRKKKALT